MKKYLDNIVTVFVILAVFLIIIPLPTWLLDMLFVVNIALSLTILLITMYIKEPLEFAIFPSLLLITTIFRLGLNISSTRLILANQGNAGHIVAAFGSFVMKGNPVIGFIVFILITVVQMLVVTKGAERVAEVTARFTLDAMPGKQMAIDADLNSGTINETEAKIRREKIQRESDFFGAMDGASKFIKGDATFSIVAAVVNLLGGAVMGLVYNGMAFSDVLTTYSMATVGDGLCSQVPSLLISTAMGMIVTRSASKENLAVDVKNQFAAQPIVLMISGAIMLLLMLIPGFPKPQLIVLGSGLLALGYILRRNNTQLALEQGAEQSEIAENKEALSEMEYYKDIDNVYKLLEVEPIEMEFGYSLIPLAD